jgi:hypothetical protein
MSGTRIVPGIHSLLFSKNDGEGSHERERECLGTQNGARHSTPLTNICGGLLGRHPGVFLALGE